MVFVIGIALAAYWLYVSLARIHHAFEAAIVINVVVSAMALVVFAVAGLTAAYRGLESYYRQGQ
jgi:hypothetical protein